MGIASSNLPLISTVVLEFAIVPFVMSLWFNSTSLLSFGMTLFLLGWEYCIRFGLGLDNPVSAYVGTEQYEAQRLFISVLGFIAIFSAMIGSFYAYILDLPEVNPLYALFPSSQRSVISFKGQWKKKKNKLGQLEENPDHPPRDSSKYTFLERGRFLHIARPYFYCFVITVMFILAVPLPHIIFSLTMDDWPIIGLLCVIIIPAVVYVLLGLYLYYRPNLFANGASAKNVKEYNKFHYGDKNLLPVMRDGDGNPILDDNGNQMYGFTTTAKERQATRLRGVYTTLIIGVPHVLSNLVLGLVRFFREDVDWNLIIAVIILAIILIFTIAFGLYFWWMTSERDEDDEFDEFACELKPSKKQKSDEDLQGVQVQGAEGDTAETETTTTDGSEQTQVSSNYHGYNQFSNVVNRFSPGQNPALGIMWFGNDVYNNQSYPTKQRK